MPILVSKIIAQSNSALDAEGSDRYLFDQDFKPAINYAIGWIVSVLNSAMETDKFSGESLRELIKISIWQANNFSRVAFNESDTGIKLWTVLAIYPNPVTFPSLNPNPDADKSKSKFMPTLSYVSGNSCTNRLTLEQWNDNKKNVFMPGNILLEGELSEFAYLNFVDYSSTGYNNPGVFELEIRPSVSNKLVGIAYLKSPSDVMLDTDSIQFPDSLSDIIVEKTLQFISYKQGNNTTLYTVTERDVNRLVSLLQ